MKIYTDRSKTAEGVGCAVIHKDVNSSVRMSNNAPILRAELIATEKALQESYSLVGESNFTIFSDSFSSLTVIMQYNSMILLLGDVRSGFSDLLPNIRLPSFTEYLLTSASKEK